MSGEEEDVSAVAQREPLRRIRKVHNSSTVGTDAAADELASKLGSMQVSQPKQPVGKFAEMRASRKSVAGEGPIVHTIFQFLLTNHILPCKVEVYLVDKDSV